MTMVKVRLFIDEWTSMEKFTTLTPALLKDIRVLSYSLEDISLTKNEKKGKDSMPCEQLR